MKFIRNYILKQLNITIRKAYKHQDKYPALWCVRISGGTLRIYTAKYSKERECYYDERYAVFKLWKY